MGRLDAARTTEPAASRGLRVAFDSDVEEFKYPAEEDGRVAAPASPRFHANRPRVELVSREAATERVAPPTAVTEEEKKRRAEQSKRDKAANVARVSALRSPWIMRAQAQQRRAESGLEKGKGRGNGKGKSKGRGRFGRG